MKHDNEFEKGLTLVLFCIGVAALLLRLCTSYAASRRLQSAKPKLKLTAVHQPLKWMQITNVWGFYELRSGDELVMTLRFPTTWSFQQTATGESADGCWNLKLPGVPKSRVAIRACGSDDVIGMYRQEGLWSRRGNFSGALELLDGRTFRFVRTAPRVYSLQNELDETLIQFTHTAGWRRHYATVDIQQIALRHPELPWLVMLGWYLIVVTYIPSRYP